MNGILSDPTLFLKKQLECWPEARIAFEALDKLCQRTISSSGLSLQYNPARMGSTAARIDPASIEKRPCFLCSVNRPQQQIASDLGDGYDLLVNPFPILKDHFTVVSRQHQPQSARACYVKMLSVASVLPDRYVVFYNGPRSGASAPDHLHFQFGLAKGIPLIDKLRCNELPDKERFTIAPFGFPITVVRHVTSETFRSYLDTLTILEGDYEPRLNIIVMKNRDELLAAFIPRGRHRPECYYSEGEEQRVVSPGALDMAGLIITPRKEDFEKLTESEILNIYKEVTPGQPEIRVGIMHGAGISFTLDTPYTDGTGVYSGDMEASMSCGVILWQNEKHSSLVLRPVEGVGRFTLHGVTIGKEFHWERQESQSFAGSLEIVPDNDGLWAVNSLPVEDYLASVVSSEMNPDAPKEFLKAHAVISRSWVLAQIEASRHHHTEPVESVSEDKESIPCDPDCHIRWYDHDQHTLFDVCADDHCQRYQGLCKISNPNAVKAVNETYAETLTYDGRLCDARFSKCCGGLSEQFETCWQDRHLDYLTPVRDASFTDPAIPDLTDEEQADRWIRSNPQSFCSHPSEDVLHHVLNNYDRETTGFYRWSVRYEAESLSELFERKSGIHLGRITSLKPLRRGPSARIWLLEITGTEGRAVIGKELEIRRVLSESHLYSSAFVVDSETGPDGLPSAFVLTGAGWGHGVGLCQIGAAVMGDKGYTYKEILRHYYPGTSLGKFY